MTSPTPVSTDAAAPGPVAPRDPVLEWWNAHCHPVTGNPGTRAQLRRARSAIEAATIEAAVMLARRVGALRVEARSDDVPADVALNLARLLAHVKEHDPKRRPMQAAGWSKFPGDRKESESEDRPLLSEVRFRHLVETESGEEQVAAFRRLVALLDSTVNVPALAYGFLRWRSDRTRRSWTFDYYAARIAAPDDTPTTSIPEDDA